MKHCADCPFIAECPDNNNYFSTCIPDCRVFKDKTIRKLNERYKCINFEIEYTSTGKYSLLVSPMPITWGLYMTKQEAVDFDFIVTAIETNILPNIT